MKMVSMMTLEEAWRMKAFGRRARVCGVIRDLASVDDTVDLFRLRRESIEDTKTDDVRVRLCLKTMKMDLACRCAIHYSVYRKPKFQGSAAKHFPVKMSIPGVQD